MAENDVPLPPGYADEANALIGVTLDVWSKADQARRQAYLDGVFQVFEERLQGIFEEANRCAEESNGLAKKFRNWRIGIMILAGGLAILNVIISWVTSGEPAAANSTVNLAAWLALIAAIYAAGLALFTNVESFHNYFERTQGGRLCRDLYLNLYWTQKERWITYVIALNDTPQACCNASGVFRELVAGEVEIRNKYRDLSSRRID